MGGIAAVGGIVVLAYLIGSIPNGLLIARFVKGVDIRQHGSGNIGATNVGRILGARWGTVALLLDALKGGLPVLFLPLMAVAVGNAETTLERGNLAVLTGIMTILGHMFPCWLGFRGGKGVATGLGVAACLSPWGTAISFVVFVASFAVWRIVSLGSMLAAVSFAITQCVLSWPAPFSPEHLGLTIFSLAVPTLIVVRHASNLRRLIHGDEAKYTLGKEKGKGAEMPGDVIEHPQSPGT